MARVLMVMIAALFVLTSSARAAPSVRDIARQHFEAGRVFYERGDFARALDQFEEGYRLTGLADLQYNIAQCHEKLFEPDKAIEAYRLYLANGNPSAEERDYVERRIAIIGRGAREAEAEDESPPLPAAEDEEPEPELSVDEMITQAERMSGEAKQFVQRAESLANAARERDDLIKLNVVNDKLIQMRALANVLDEAFAAMRTAAAAGDSATVSHEFQRCTVTHQRIKGLASEAENAVGEELQFVAETTVDVEFGCGSDGRPGDWLLNEMAGVQGTTAGAACDGESEGPPGKWGVGVVAGVQGIHSGGHTAPFAGLVGPRLSYEYKDEMRFCAVAGPLFAGRDEQGRDPVGVFAFFDTQWLALHFGAFVPVIGVSGAAAAVDFGSSSLKSQLKHIGGHIGLLWDILQDTGVSARFLVGDQPGRENTGTSWGWVVVFESRVR